VVVNFFVVLYASDSAVPCLLIAVLCLPHSSSMYSQRSNGGGLYPTTLQQYFTSSPEHIQQHQANNNNIITSVAGNHMWSTGKRESREQRERARALLKTLQLHRRRRFFLFFFSVVPEDGAGGGYSPTSAGGNKSQSNNGGGGLPAFAQRFATHASSATAYTAAGSSRTSTSYHPITTSGVMPYHLTSAAVNNAGAGGASDASSLQWATVASHSYPNTDGTINYVPITNSQARSRSNASFSAAASLSACKYTTVHVFL